MKKADRTTASRGCSRNRRDLVEAEYLHQRRHRRRRAARRHGDGARCPGGRESVRLVHADGEERRAATARCRRRQRHLSIGGRPPASGGVRVPGAAERHHARVFRPHGRFPFRTGERRGYARGLERGAQPRRRRPAECEVSLLQRVAAYDLCRDRAPGRSRRERAATDRPGDGELPAASGREPGNRAADARARPGRCSDRGGADWNADAEPAVSARA